MVIGATGLTFNRRQQRCHRTANGQRVIVAGVDPHSPYALTSALHQASWRPESTPETDRRLPSIRLRPPAAFRSQDVGTRRRQTAKALRRATAGKDDTAQQGWRLGKGKADIRWLDTE
jgi:hypothetical protein